MSNIVPFNEMQSMAMAVTKSGMFGLKNENQALTLMLIAQAEGVHPIQAVQMYSIINGMPALKSTEIQSRFQRAGGKVAWPEHTNTKAVAVLTFEGSEYVSEFTMQDAKVMGLADKDNWKKMPKQMLMARAITMGVRAIYPACLNNMYLSDEVADFTNAQIEQNQVLENFVEVEVEPIINPEVELKLAKSSLQRKLTDLSMSISDIKGFVQYYNLSDNIDAIRELNADDGALLERVKEYESTIETGE